MTMIEDKEDKTISLYSVGLEMLTAAVCLVPMQSFQELFAEPQNKLIHVATPVVDFTTLDNLAAQEAGHVVFRLAAVCHLPGLQAAVDEPPAVVAARFELRGGASTLNGRRVDERASEQGQEHDGAEKRHDVVAV